MPPDTIPVSDLVVPTELKGDLQDAVNDLFGGEDGAFDQDDKDRLLEGLADAVNVKVNIPFIGERVERAVILLVLKMVLRLGEKYGRRYLNDLVGRLT